MSQNVLSATPNKQFLKLSEATKHIADSVTEVQLKAAALIHLRREEMKLKTILVGRTIDENNIQKIELQRILDTARKLQFVSNF